LLFPFCITLSEWFAFALGTMGCTLPNKCFQPQENAKGILELVILFGGGFGILIATGILADKFLQSGDMTRSKHA
jgi:hypothetical protein